jgi:hypothetical protein
MLSNLQNDWKKGRLHHAYCFEGLHEVIFPQICFFLENDLQFQTKGNPDFQYQRFDNFTIEEGRQLKELQILRPARGGKKIFIISTNFINREAQDSLLKIFEEPAENTHFFLIIPSSENLLPTLQSRLNIVKSKDLTSGDATEHSLSAKEFMHAKKSKRLSLIKPILEDKDKIRALRFLSDLEKYLHSSYDMKKMTKDESANFQAILQGKKFLSDRSSSIKIILENIALMLE